MEGWVEVTKTTKKLSTDYCLAVITPCKLKRVTASQITYDTNWGAQMLREFVRELGANNSQDYQLT